MKKNYANAADLLRNGAKKVIVSTGYLNYRELSSLAELAMNSEAELVVTVCDNMSVEDVKGIIRAGKEHVSIDMR